MDDLDAPQWADFTAPSPQASVDTVDYFLRRHNKLDSSNLSVTKHNISKQLLNEASHVNESLLHKTPVRVMSAKGSKSSIKRSNLKETTYENVLMEAMNNLQLSFKKQTGEKSINKSCLIDSPAFITPVKRVTRSMCAQASSIPKQDLNESHYVSLNDENEYDQEHEDAHKIKEEHECINNIEGEHEHEGLHKVEEELGHGHQSKQTEENMEDIAMKEHESPTDEQTSEIHLELTASGSEHEISHQRMENIPEPVKENPNSEISKKKEHQVPKSKVVTSFASQQSGPGSGSKKKVTALTGNAWHKQMKRRMSITNQRQMSLNKATTSYVSMAEAVTKFQRATPQRFRTMNVKTTRTEQLRRASFKLTRATSPTLMCKNRSRPITAISREEQERLELEKIRQNQIKANPVRKNILKKPAPLKKVEKKMLTNPEPFHLTATKKGLPPLPEQSQETKRAPRTKTVPSIVSTDDKGIIVKEEEVLHFGIPLEPCKTKKKNTKVMPFSFEARNRELQLKKQEKLKLMQETEKKLKTKFHARPVPAAVKTPIDKPPLVFSNSLQKPKFTITHSLSFEDRQKQLQKKKEDKIKKLLEEEKKARVFRAQKVPEFKPVIIRGRSRDNLKKSQENLATKSHNVSGNTIKSNISLKRSRENLATKSNNFIKKSLSIPFIAPKKISPPSVVTENQENCDQGAVPKILEPKCKLSHKSVTVLTELNTDIRAKQRKEFDEQIKKKEIEEEEMKRKEKEERISKEKAQKLELRKMTEIKARPMPVYKSMNILKSNKPLTDAQSPAWAKRKGSTH